MNNIEMIVAFDQNNGIGKDNKLLYHFKKDMERFVEKTINKTVVMGRKTAESLPDKKPLKDRRNIILSRDKNFKLEGFKVYHSIEEIINLASESKDIFIIIGGQEIYKQFLPFTDKIYITLVYSKKEADTHFFFDPLEWKRELIEINTTKKQVKYEFWNFTRE